MLLIVNFPHLTLTSPSKSTLIKLDIFIILMGERTRRSGVGEKSEAKNPREADNFK